MAEIAQVFLIVAGLYMMVFLLPLVQSIIEEIMDRTTKEVLWGKIKKLPSNIKGLWRLLFEEGD